jgi:hypothetical protein
MTTISRKAKITEEHLKEAAALSELWSTRSRSSQAEFGEHFDIGNQSSVNQFLNGLVPLSLKAAAGFAKGLNCTIADFSPRLADLATQYAALSGFDIDELDLTRMDRDELRLVLLFRKITPEWQQAIIHQTMMAVKQCSGKHDEILPLEISAEYQKGIAAKNATDTEIKKLVACTSKK